MRDVGEWWGILLVYRLVTVASVLGKYWGCGNCARLIRGSHTLTRSPACLAPASRAGPLTSHPVIVFAPSPLPRFRSPPPARLLRGFLALSLLRMAPALRAGPPCSHPVNDLVPPQVLLGSPDPPSPPALLFQAIKMPSVAEEAARSGLAPSPGPCPPFGPAPADAAAAVDASAAIAAAAVAPDALMAEGSLRAAYRCRL